MLILISYPVNRHMPLYPNTPAIEYHSFRSMEKGDNSDHTLVSLSCHTGTHIDTPRHFCLNGSDVARSLRPVNSFSPAYCIDLDGRGDTSIVPEDLDPLIAPSMTDALAILIRTGWSSCRANNPEEYVSDNPWVEESTADFLRARFPEIRLLGIDTISIGNLHHREEGRASHRAFLCRDNPIMLLEDADLSDPRISGGPFQISIFPLVIDAVEATPVVATIESVNRDRRNRQKEQICKRDKCSIVLGEYE